MSSNDKPKTQTQTPPAPNATPTTTPRESTEAGRSNAQKQQEEASAAQQRQHEIAQRENPTQNVEIAPRGSRTLEGRAGIQHTNAPPPVARPAPPPVQEGMPEPIKPKAMRVPEFIPENNPNPYPEVQQPNAPHVAPGGTTTQQTTTPANPAAVPPGGVSNTPASNP